MSATISVPSNLSSPKYGYDIVVATTQSSINATLKNFLNSLTEPVVTICYVADPSGNPVYIDYSRLKTIAHGSDPFQVPNNADPNTNPDLKNLFQARFMMGFCAQLGLPNVAQPWLLPDIVTLGSDTSAITFKMLCSTFTVVQLEPSSGYSAASWMNQAQDPNKPWIFTSKVDMRLSTVDQDAYSHLPAKVQEKIMNLGSEAFSVQQLLFDFSNASLMTVPTISGVLPGTRLYSVLQQIFLGAYFSEMNKDSTPLLGCSIVAHTPSISTLRPTSLNFEVDPYLNPQGEPYSNPTNKQEQLAVLCYLCSVDGKPLPPAVAFDWNWVDSSQQLDHSGVVSINRNSLVNYFRTKLESYVPKNCLCFDVDVWSSDVGLMLNFSATPIAGQTPTITTPDSGSTVLSYSYTRTDESKSHYLGLITDGSLSLTNTYSLTVEFIDKTIVITQHQVVYGSASNTFVCEGNLIDKTIVDTYTLDINADGGLVANLDSKPTDNSDKPSVAAIINWVSGLNDLITFIESTLTSVDAELQDLPVSTIQDFVFPGGQTFVFKNVGFSNYQDLVSYITYADPTPSRG